MFKSICRWLTSWLKIGTGGQSCSAPQTGAAPPPAGSASDASPSWNATTAVELIARLMELTTTVGDEVEEHSGHIDSINAELSGVKHDDSAAVAAVVCKLLVFNQE